MNVLDELGRRIEETFQKVLRATDPQNQTLDRSVADLDLESPRLGKRYSSETRGQQARSLAMLARFCECDERPTSLSGLCQSLGHRI